jgi:K+-sensing histidine kinase KdpD
MSDAPLRIALLGALPRGGERLRRWLLQASDEAGTAAPVFCNDPADADAVLVACETPADAARIAALRQRLPDLPMVAVPLGSSKGRAEAGAAGLKAGADDLFDLASARRASAFALLCRLRARVAANRRFAAERAEAEHFLEAFCHSVAHDLRGPLHVVRGSPGGR